MGRWGAISVEATLHPGHRGALLGQGVRSTEEGLGGLLGKAAGAAEGRPAWTKGVS